MQICEYFFENACYSVTKYYLCKQNNKRSLLGRKQRSQVIRSFPNRYLFSYTNKVTSLFSTSCILRIILSCNLYYIALQSLSRCFMILPECQNNRRSMGWQLRTSCAFDSPTLANTIRLHEVKCACEINSV